jgi:hypothetical protein
MGGGEGAQQPGARDVIALARLHLARLLQVLSGACIVLVRRVAAG